MIAAAETGPPASRRSRAMRAALLLHWQFRQRGVVRPIARIGVYEAADCTALPHQKYPGHLSAVPSQCTRTMPGEEGLESAPPYAPSQQLAERPTP